MIIVASSSASAPSARPTLETWERYLKELEGMPGDALGIEVELEDARRIVAEKRREQKTAE